MSQLNHLKSAMVSIVQVLCLYLATTVHSYAANTMDALSDRQQAIIPIAALTAAGNATALEQALSDGLENGLTVNEVKEIFIHSYAYAGFPRALNGINTFIRVLDSRKERGINDEPGNEATPVPPGFNANAYGHKVRNELVGRDISKRTTGYAAFVPTIDLFLVEHLFGDIFYRDVFTPKDRELVTISILAAMPGNEAQLNSHINLSLRVGYTPAQLLHFTSVLTAKVSPDSARRALAILQKATNIEIDAPRHATVEVNRDRSVAIAPNDRFTGTAKITSRFQSPVASNYGGAIVDFEAGARTAWHTHPNGQMLIVISGKGLVQSEDSAVQEILSGDVVTIPPNTRHWHGAAPDSPMSHVAISTPENGKTVTWMELVADGKPH